MIELYDSVRLLEEQSDIKAGTRGAVIDCYDSNPDIVTVEFFDEQDRTIGVLELHKNQLQLVEKTKAKGSLARAPSGRGDEQV